MSTSNMTKAGYIYIRNPCTRYNPLRSDNNTAGQQTLTRLPPHSYIVNERYNPRNKRASKEKKQSVANPNPGRPRKC